MTKKTKKGFTLLELIVVMAIFSILMVGVMSLIQPVSNMFQSASMSEKTYSYANNVQEYLQTKLEYAEDVYIGTESKMGLTENGSTNDEKLAGIVEEFRNKYFTEVVKTDDGGNNIDYVNGKIHVVRLVNKDGTLRDGSAVHKGQITHRVYDFNSAKGQIIKGDADVEEVAELNPAFLEATDAAYDFSYALGASKLVGKDKSDLNSKVANTLKAKEDYKVLDLDYSNTFNKLVSSDISLTIVLNKKSGGTVDCEGTDAVGTFDYKAFATPCSIQVVNLPLTNIAYRSAHGSTTAKGISRPAKDSSGKVVMQGTTDPAVTTGSAFTWNAEDHVDLDQDIYFIYCFTDEIES